MPQGTITTRKSRSLSFQSIDVGSYEKRISLWVERLVDFWWRSHCEGRAKEMYTARCPKTGPRGRERTKAGLKL